MARTKAKPGNVPAQTRQRHAANGAAALREMALSLLAKGNAVQAVDVLVAALESMQRDNERLTYHLAIARRARYGHNSEKINAEQLGQLVLALGGSQQEAEAAEPLVPVPQQPSEEGHNEPAADTPKKKRPHRHGRSRLSPELPRHITLVPVH
jgi:hypothetical protein